MSTIGVRITLYCVPYAGGNMWAYRPLETLLLPGIGLSGIELPGRGRRSTEPLIPSLEPLADDVFRQLEPHVSAGRYALLGHSMGALLALLAARRIRRAGLPLPEALFVSACEAPAAQKRRTRHALPTQAFLAMLREMGGCPPEFLQDPDLLAFFEPILRADFTAVETWVASLEPPLDVPVTAMIGKDDDVSVEAAHAWARETTTSCRVMTFAGDHFFILRHWAAIASVIGEELAGVGRPQAQA